ncbi:MAG: hypothetical protein GY808_03755 [Gammaproteobacteria bacterium]|nr:hypothetical protein [Gammaproteobacteria bacterium]
MKKNWPTTSWQMRLYWRLFCLAISKSGGSNSKQKQFMGSLGKGDTLILLSATSKLEIDSLIHSDIRKNQVQIILICPYSPSTNYHVS